MGIDRARTALEYIKTHPDEWDQTVWVCGTAACIAGHIVLNAGADPINDGPDTERCYHARYGDDVHVIPNLARQLLGITPLEAGLLFRPRNGLTELEYYIGMLEGDLLLTHPDNFYTYDFEHEWRNSNGIICVAAHRRTAIVWDGGTATETHHHSRAAAHDYASDVASCRTLTYTHNDVWSTGE